jgi:hypothetical protein
MPRRRRGVTLGRTLVAAGILAAGCQADAPSAGCRLDQQVVLPGTPLTLLGEARLDRIGAGFVLLGSDGTNVRWVALDGVTGAPGVEHGVPVEGVALEVWSAVAGVQAPGDTVLVAQSAFAANHTDIEIQVRAVAADGSAAPASGAVVATYPDAPQFADPPPVAMGSSRAGGAAGLAWVDYGRQGVMVMGLAGSGQPLGSPSQVDTAAAFACLKFVPGRNDLTLTYVKYSDATLTTLSLGVVEMREDGTIESTLLLPINGQNPRCPQVVATDAGYALAGQDDVGSWLALYDRQLNRIVSYPFASAVAFGGTNAQPPLEGLAPIGADFGVVLAMSHSAQVWRLDAMGNRRRGALELPSAEGKMGTLSSLPSDGHLTVTYADYTGTGADVGATGQRYFVTASCF